MKWKKRHSFSNFIIIRHKLDRTLGSYGVWCRCAHHLNFDVNFNINGITFPPKKNHWFKFTMDWEMEMRESFDNGIVSAQNSNKSVMWNVTYLRIYVVWIDKAKMLMTMSWWDLLIEFANKRIVRASVKIFPSNKPIVSYACDALYSISCSRTV